MILIVGSLPFPLLLTFVLDYYQMTTVMTLLKCATTCARVCNYRNYHLFPRFQGGFHAAGILNDTLIFFVYANKSFLWAIQKIVLVTLWLDVLFVESGFTKNARALVEKSFLQKINIKNGSVVTANCNVYDEKFHLWNFFVFSGTLMDVYFSIMNCCIYYRGSRIWKQVPKTVSKNSCL